jgi:glycosyltransferase involved in cell wall biosynthesis
MRVAYYSPLPPERSGIADYSAHLLPALEQRIEVTVARRRSRRPPRGCDLDLYHIGNNPDAHEWIVEVFRKRPGIVVLHDVVLHHLVAGMTVARERPDGYIEAMQRDSGIVGRLLAHGVVDGVLQPLWEERAADFPLTMWVVEPAAGIIVHSRYAERRLRELGFERPVWRIPMPAWPVPASAQASGRQDPVIGCFGHMNSAKRLPQLLDAFARLRRRRPGAQLVLGGGAAPGFDLAQLVTARKLEDAVVRYDYLDAESLWRLIAEADVLVNLRSPTMGETSGMVVRALSIGKPLVVSDVGWFSELPDDVAVKVPADERETELLDSALERLAGDADLRKRMGEAAADWARTEHDLDRTAELYVAALEEAAGLREVEHTVLRDVAGAAAELGIDPDSPELTEVGARLREAGLGRDARS